MKCQCCWKARRGINQPKGYKDKQHLVLCAQCELEIDSLGKHQVIAQGRDAKPIDWMSVLQTSREIMLGVYGDKWSGKL